MKQRIEFKPVQAVRPSYLEMMYKHCIVMRRECAAMRQSAERARQSIEDVTAQLALAQSVLADARSLVSHSPDAFRGMIDFLDRKA